MRKSIYTKAGLSSRIIVSVVNDTTTPVEAVTEPAQAVEWWNSVVAKQPDFEPEKETVVVLLLSACSKIIAWNRVSIGLLNECLVHPREVLRPVIVGNAHSFIVMHNHPSGSTSPSVSDKDITRRIRDAAHIVGIPMMDHVIVRSDSPGLSDYFSFREFGLL